MVALVRRIVVAVILVVWFFPPAGSARAAEIPSASRGPLAARTTIPAGPIRAAPATSTELRRYAEREAEARGLERFEGGGRISASTTTIIIILLLVIIILILV